MGLRQILEDYNIHEMSHWRHESDLALQYFVNINGLVLLGKHSEAIRLGEAQFSILRLPKIDVFVQFLICCEHEKEISELMFKVVDDGVNPQIHPYIKGEFYFTVGYGFMLLKNFPLAAEYLKKSIEVFYELDLQAFVWRSEFNLYICEKKNAKSKAAFALKKKCMSNYSRLPKIAKLYFSRFLVWDELDEFNLKKARHIIHLTLSQMDHGAENNSLYEFLKQTQIYFLFKDNRFSHSLSVFEDIDTPFLKSVKKIENINSDCTLKAIKGLVADLALDNSSIDLSMLYDLLCERILAMGKYDLIVDIYSDMQEKISDDFLQIADLREYALISYRFLGKEKTFEKLYRKYALSATKKRIDDFNSRLSLITPNSKIIILNLKSKECVFSGKTYSLKRSEAAFKVLHKIFLEKKVAAEDLCRYVYGSGRSTDEVRLRRLIKRLLKVIFQENIFYFANGSYLLNKGYAIKFMSAESKASRVSGIYQFIKNRKGVSIRQIQEHFGYVSTRSLQLDLKFLIERRRIVSSGKGKNTVYLLE